MLEDGAMIDDGARIDDYGWSNDKME